MDRATPPPRGGAGDSPPRAAPAIAGGRADRVHAAALDANGRILGVSRSWRGAAAGAAFGIGAPPGADYAAALEDGSGADHPAVRTALAALRAVRQGDALERRCDLAGAAGDRAARLTLTIRRLPDDAPARLLVEFEDAAVESASNDAALSHRLRCMDELARALQGGLDLERTLGRAVEAVRNVLECDRAWLLTPCDPSAATWTVPVESHAPAFPGAAAGDAEIPQDELSARIFRESLAADGPVAYGPDRAPPGAPRVLERFGVRSQAVVALRPGSFPRWLLGVHQCEYARLWTPDEVRLLQDMAVRVTAALTAVLLHRDLARSEERHRELFENLHDGAYRCTADGTIVEANPALVSMLGYASRHELVGQDIRSLLHPDSEAAYPRGDETVPPCRLVGGGGREVWVEGSVRLVTRRPGDPTHAEGILRDVTARRQIERALRDSEAQLRQAQKMEAVGRLAGGVAHDFNNLLVAITGFGSLLLDRLDEDDPLRRYAFQIDRAATRAATLTRQLLAFSRKQILRPAVLDLNRVVEDVRRILDRTIGEDVEAVTILDRELWRVKADPGQLEQVLLNLAVNARDAMPDGGRLTIATRNIVLDRDEAARLPDVTPGSYAALLVRDTGCGMDADTMRRCFEPFFTTKDSGKGTGLGLATVYGIVTQSGGTIRVASRPGEGSTFEVLLPRATALDDPDSDAGDVTEELDGTATILLVEDEAVVRALVREVLEEYGYSVIEAGSGHEALAHCQGATGEIDLLVTDVVMPRMGGRELAEEVTRLRPGVRVLFISGYAPWADDAASDVHFLAKPFTPSALARAVQAVLQPS